MSVDNIPSLIDLVKDWLETLSDKNFHYDVLHQLIRCGSEICRGHIAIINDCSVSLRPRIPIRNGGSYKTIHAADPDFFIKLENHLRSHACSDYQ